MQKQHKRSILITLLALVLLSTTLACTLSGLLGSGKEEVAATPDPVQVEQVAEQVEESVAEEAVELEAPTAQEAEVEIPHQQAVSGLASGWYSYVNSNVIRDIAIHNGVAHTATLGGMNAWNLTSGYVMQYSPLQGMGHVSAYAAVLCELPEVRVVVGTSKGLTFYDPNTGLWENVSITPPDSKVDVSKIDRLYCDQANNRLLIGYNGLGILDLNNGAFTHYKKDEGLSWNVVADIAVAGKDIWVASGYNGITRISGDKTTLFNKDNGMPDERAGAVAVAPDGTIWVGTSSALLAFKGNVWTEYGKDTEAKLTDISNIRIAPDGKLWVSTAPMGGGRLCQFDPNSGACVQEHNVGQPVIALALDEENRPLYGTNRGMYLFDNGNAIPFLQESDPLASNFVDALAGTPDGKLWVGTDGGIHLMDPGNPSSPWQTFKARENQGMGGNWASQIAVAPDGTAWFAIINGNASRYKDGTWISFEDMRSFDCVAVDGQGNAWFGDDGKGIIVLDASGNPVTTYTSAEGLPSDNVYALLPDGNDMWVATDKGLAKVIEGKSQIILAENDPGLPNKYIRRLAYDSQGHLVIGTILGIARYDGNTASVVVTFKDLGVGDWLTAMTVAPDDSIWFGTINGLFHSSDMSNWQVMTSADGLNSAMINEIHFDQYGALWVGSGSNYAGGGLMQWVP